MMIVLYLAIIAAAIYAFYKIDNWDIDEEDFA